MALQTLLNSKKVLPKPQGIYNPFLNKKFEFSNFVFFILNFLSKGCSLKG